MKNIFPPESLIRYEPSVQIDQSMKVYHQEEKHKNQNILTSSPKVQQILDSILPPRDWTDHHNKLHIQYVSHQPSSREDVNELTETLDSMLRERQAKTSGICPIRQELYRQAFDELIRQVAVDCPERGLLQMRVRDEHMMTLAAYQTIYQSSVAYGIRKQIQSEEGCDKIEQEYQNLVQQKEELAARKSLLLCKKDLVQKQIKENRLIQMQKKEEQIKILKLQKQNMTKFLEAVKNEFRTAY